MNMNGKMLLASLLPDADRYPFVLEQIAIDVTNGLTGAERALSAYRSQPLLSKIWDNFTGKGRELPSAIGFDVITVQKGTLELVKEILDHINRTQYCMQHVLCNLLVINRSLDDQIDRIEYQNQDFLQKLTDLHNQIHVEIQEATKDLEAKIESVKAQVERDRIRDWLQRHYENGEVYPGTGDILRAALYLAQVKRLFASELAESAQREWEIATQHIKAKMAGPPQYVPDLLLQELQCVKPDLFEVLAYISWEHKGPALITLDSLVKQRGINGNLDKRIAIKLVESAREAYHDDWHLAHYIRPEKLAERIALELTTSSDGDES